MTDGFTIRKLDDQERRLLLVLEKQLCKKNRPKIRTYHFIIAAVLGGACTFAAASIPDSFWTFLLGTIALFSFSFIVVIPYELFKQQKAQKKMLGILQPIIANNKIKSWKVNALQIAVAEEFDDEGELYLAELDAHHVLCIWDNQLRLPRQFPCLEFEIYEDDFIKLTGRMILPRSEKVKPIQIHKQAKWDYLNRIGSPAHLEILQIPFQTLVTTFQRGGNI